MAHYREDIVDIELETGSVFRSFMNKTIGTGDSKANRYGVRLFRGGEPVDVSGYACEGFFRDSHGNNILISNGVTSENVAYVTLPQACYNYEGQFTLAIKVVGGDVTGTMRIIDGVVDNTNCDNTVAPTGSVPTYQEIIAMYDEMIEATQEANNAGVAAKSTLFGSIRQLHYPNLLKGVPKEGYYVSYETGVESDLEGWQYFTVPSCGESDYYGKSNEHIAFFAKDGTFIGGGQCRPQNDYRVHIPANCAYFTFSCQMDQNNRCVLASEYPNDQDDTPVGHLSHEIHVDISNTPGIIIPRKNLFNKKHLIWGRFVDYSYKGEVTFNNEYCFCPDFIPAKPSTKYMPSTYGLAAEFDENYDWICCHNFTSAAALNQMPFTTDANCAYLRISTRIDRRNSFMLEEGEATTSYQPFMLKFATDEEGSSETREIIVDQNGMGNFTTISAACAAANDGDTIYIKDGVYQESVKINGLRVHLVGESREKTILKYTGTQYANPPLEMSNGSIENMTIWATTQSGVSHDSGGYCLHCDNVASKNGYLTCRNVKFQNDHYQVVGIGLEPNFTLSFEQCEFIGQFYCHDSKDSFSDMTGQVLRLVDCSIIASNSTFGAIRMQSQEKSGAEATAVFQRCIVKNTGGGPVVTMSLFSDPGLPKDKWLGSSDWTLDGMSALNNSNSLNA